MGDGSRREHRRDQPVARRGLPCIPIIMFQHCVNCETSRSGSLRARRRSSRSIEPRSCFTRSKPSATYTYEYLCFRITDYRPESWVGTVTISGAEASHDLRLFVEDLSDSANIGVEEVREPVHTVEDLSRMFNVSTKTISRWRRQGLVSRRFVFDGRKASRLSGQQCAAVRGEQSGAGATRRAVQPADGVGTRATSSSGLGGWRMPAVGRPK